MTQKIKKNKILLFLLAISLIVLIAYAVNYNQTITITPTLTVKFPAWSQISESFSLNFIIKRLTSLTESFNLNLINIPLRSFVNSLNLNLIQIPIKNPIESLIITIFFPASKSMGNNINLSIVCSNCSFQAQSTTTGQSPSPSGINITSPQFFNSSNFTGIINIIIIAIFIFSPAFILLEITKSTLGFIFGAGLGTIILVVIGVIPMWVLFLAIVILFALVFMRREVG